MSTSSLSTRRAIAGLVTVAGVALILAIAAMQQRGQTETYARKYLGEQWDVARNCLLGTPLHRREPRATIVRRLRIRLLEALAALSEDDARPETLWPARCAGIFPSLHADRSIMRRDPGDALATLEVLAPRVLPSQPPYSAAELDARAVELADAIVRLDAAMPPGAALRAERYPEPPPGVEPAHVLPSLSCESPRPLAFFDPVVLSDRGTIRVRASGDRTFERIMSGASRVLMRPGARPLVWDDHTVAWIHADQARVTLHDLDRGTDGASALLDPSGSFFRVALCRTPRGAFFFGQRAQRTWRIAWPGPDQPPEPPLPLALSPPPDAIAACGAMQVLAWRSNDRWVGIVCEGARCEAMPPLRAGADLTLATHGSHALAVAAGTRTDLSLARTLSRRDGHLHWSDPIVVGRGALTTRGAQYELALCSGPRYRSSDGRRWTEVR